MTNTETETAAFHEDADALADYHNTRMAEEERAKERERLITIAAEGVYGMGEDNPIGSTVVTDIGRDIAAPFIDAIMAHPDVVIAVEVSTA